MPFIIYVAWCNNWLCLVVKLTWYLEIWGEFNKKYDTTRNTWRSQLVDKKSLVWLRSWLFKSAGGHWKKRHRPELQRRFFKGLCTSWTLKILIEQCKICSPPPLIDSFTIPFPHNRFFNHHFPPIIDSDWVIWDL